MSSERLKARIKNKRQQGNVSPLEPPLGQEDALAAAQRSGRGLDLLTFCIAEPGWDAATRAEIMPTMGACADARSPELFHALCEASTSALRLEKDARVRMAFVRLLSGGESGIGPAAGTVDLARPDVSKLLKNLHKAWKRDGDQGVRVASHVAIQFVYSVSIEYKRIAEEAATGRSSSLLTPRSRWRNAAEQILGQGQGAPPGARALLSPRARLERSIRSSSVCLVM